jgi:hypothetical protein
MREQLEVIKEGIRFPNRVDEARNRRLLLRVLGEMIRTSEELEKEIANGKISDIRR